MRTQLGVVGQENALGESGHDVQRLLAGRPPALAARQLGQQRVEPRHRQVTGLDVDLLGDRVGVPHAHQLGVVAEPGQGRTVSVGERQPLIVVHFGEDVVGEPEDRLR
ncbi:hypothetical protein [Glycomyces xiaoerkulensis]|uniref:hypothetical protein n=1 Tax=Glycomyces xiaoerkulensis TaxID=2038139 RepID=UPI0013000A3A|nr:hypothetical protein [Glycomyces xiaoerkulensis]